MSHATPPSVPLTGPPRPPVDASGEAGPPPPPAPPGSDRESRATAATWVAGTGALLLLAAAGTFLAVSWDALGLTARIAVVAAVTGAAILGGHRLRSRLPAVGAVLFHLGAFLVPVDALGLAVQLDAASAMRWISVGATAVLVLPLLAAGARSTTLAWGAVAGIPVLATGVGLLGIGIDGSGLAALLVAGAALVGAVASSVLPGWAADAQERRRFAGTASWALAATAVVLPVVVAAVAAVPGTVGAVEQIAAAGWLPTTWWLVLGTGALAVAAIVIVATRERSRGLTALAMSSAAVVSLTALLPATTPSSVLVVLPAMLAVLIQVSALGGRASDLWAAPTRVLALVTEPLVAVATVSLLLDAVVLRTAAVAPAEQTVAIVLLGLAWAVAAVRRVEADGARTAPVPLLAALSLVQLALAVSYVGLGDEVVVALLLAGAFASLAWRPRADAGDTQRDAALAASGVAVALCATAGLFAVGLPAIGIVVAAVAVLTGVHVRAMGTRSDAVVVATRSLVIPAAVVTILLGGAAMEFRSDAVPGWAAILVVVALLGLATSLDVRPMAADAVRGVTMVVGVAVTSSLLGAGSMVGTTAWSRLVVAAFGLGLTAVLPAAIVALWLLADALRLRRPVVAAFAAPVLARLLASAGLALGLDVGTTGLLLLFVGVAAALAAVVGVGRWTPTVIVLAISAVTLGTPLAGVTPELRAALVVAAGLIVAASGATRGNAVVGHLGGVVAVVGTWQILILRDVAALDLWLLPLAAQLWVAGLVVRRRNHTSSWVTDVPPLLLVTVPALIERASGGGGWHAVLAGGLAVAAVIAGGSERLGGPLIMGTIVLVAIVGIETFAVVAAVPTWAWLAAGGATLLGAGAAMEHVGGSPAKAARRLVDVVNERFD